MSAPTQTAASTFSTLWPPFSGISETSMISRWPFASRKRTRPSRTYAPLLYFFLAAEPEDLRPGSAGQSRAGGIVGIQHREIFRLLVLEDARLGVRIGLERAMAVEVVGRDVEHHGNFRTKGLDRLQLEARYFQHHDGVGCGRARPARLPACRYCRRPAVGKPPAATISPASVVVVVLPFEPVMATMFPGRNCDASSISPITGSPSARACTSGGESTGTPGLTTIRSCPRNVRSPCPPVSTAMP